MAEGKEDKGKTITIRLPTVNLRRVNPWILSTIVCALVVVLMYAGVVPTSTTGGLSLINIGGLGGGGELGAQEAADKAIEYINENLVQDAGVTFVSVKESSGMYDITTLYQGTNIDVYTTKDGKWLFVSQPYDTTETVTTTTTQPAKTCADIAKSDSPQLEAFVVSYCPYGLQMQRILAEIVKNVPSLADNIKVRYIGAVSNGQVTSMHGDQEATENLRQICIREEQPDKYWAYVSCFMKSGDDVDGCLTEAGVDKSKLVSCMGSGGKGLQYAQEDFGLQDERGIGSSPTLFLNGEEVSEFDFGGRTAEAVKTLLCCGFSTEPAACAAELSTSQAATSFSETYSSSTGSTGGSTCG